ncbi:MAG: hypothetical protein M3440_14865 [Chloroflexota bacterium]|nr:hypothetical protein [Chloroflexota bacterium]
MSEFDPGALAETYGPLALATSILIRVFVSLMGGGLVSGKVHEATIGGWSEALVKMTTDRDYYRDKHETQTAQLLGVTEAIADRATQVKLLRAAQLRERGPDV